MSAPITEQWAPAITIGDLLLRTASRRQVADAVVFPAERLTYAELAGRARQLARALIGLGVGPGEHVGVLMANSLDCVATIYAIALAGAVVVPINTRYRTVELPYVIANADLTAIVTSSRIDGYSDLLGLLEDALPGLADARRGTSASSSEPRRSCVRSSYWVSAAAAAHSRRSGSSDWRRRSPRRS